MTRPLRAASVAVSLAALLSVAGCTQADTIAIADGSSSDFLFTTEVLNIDFDNTTTLSRIGQGGDAGGALVDIRPITDGSSRLNLGIGQGGRGTALDFPAFSSTGGGLAVLAIIPVGDRDAFSPAAADFRFGADFRLDAVNEGSKTDNGNNLLQRGLFADPAQFKIQIDHGVASCRVAGTDGAVTVTADQPVETDRWYASSCSRTGGTVRLRLRDLDSPDARELSWSSTGAIGSVTMASASSPISVGGKLAAGPVVASGNSDQFNGSIDNVTMSVTD